MQENKRVPVEPRRQSDPLTGSQRSNPCSVTVNVLMLLTSSALIVNTKVRFYVAGPLELVPLTIHAVALESSLLSL